MAHHYLRSRRTFFRNTIITAAACSQAGAASARSGATRLRMGAPVPARDPESWIAALRKEGYRACYCPVGAAASDDVVKSYREAASKAGIVIAEVGAWSNPISPTAGERSAAIKKCKAQLDLADRIGARCCVNITGSRNPELWSGPHEDNLTDETFDLIVETTRGIVDAVKPKRTFYTLETMPWAYPDSVDSYVKLLKAIDRKACAAHFDPVNIVTSPQRYYNNTAMIREGFKKLGPYLKSCHAKDIILRTKLTTHLDEIRPGLGGLDYRTFLKELSRIPEVPLMLEHLPNQEEYRRAAAHIRSVAKEAGVRFD